MARGGEEIDTKLGEEEVEESSGAEETVLESEVIEIVKQTTEGSKCECRTHMKWNKE